MVDEGRAGVVAIIGDFRVAGQSGKAQETSAAIKTAFPSLHAKLKSLRELEERSVFSCAEPNALANLLRQYSGKNKNPRLIRFATTVRDSSERLALCKNCQQWLEPSPSSLEYGLYCIREEFLPVLVSAPVKLSDRDFPPLGSSEKKSK